MVTKVSPPLPGASEANENSTGSRSRGRPPDRLRKKNRGLPTRSGAGEPGTGDQACMAWNATENDQDQPGTCAGGLHDGSGAPISGTETDARTEPEPEQGTERMRTRRPARRARSRARRVRRGKRSRSGNRAAARLPTRRVAEQGRRAAKEERARVAWAGATLPARDTRTGAPPRAPERNGRAPPPRGCGERIRRAFRHVRDGATAGTTRNAGASRRTTCARR